MKINSKWMLIGYLLSVLILCVLPVNTKGELNQMAVLNMRSDYFFHALVFFPFLPLVWFGRFDKSIKMVVFLFLGIAVALTSEGIQYFLPYRSFNIKDAIADLFGLFLGGLVLFVGRKKLVIE